MEVLGEPGSPSSTSLWQLVTDPVSEAGRLFHIVTGVADLLDKPLEFPATIVLGEESSGKSSVLERLAMTALFPRGEGITTRMPIRFRFRYVSQPALLEFHSHVCEFSKNIEPCSAGYYRVLRGDKSAGPYDGFLPLMELREAATVDAVSQSIQDMMLKRVFRSSDDAGFLKGMWSMVSNKPPVAGVSDEEIVVEMIGPSFPNLEFVDLPGLVATGRAGEDPEIGARTTQIAQSYLNRQHTLVLATQRAVNKPSMSRAFHLIKEAGKLDMTIGVLTMADQVKEDGPMRNQFLQLLRGELQDVHMPNGYVAVWNRDTRSSTSESLDSAAASETERFDTHFPGLVDTDLASGHALVRRVQTMMARYVKSTWVPYVLAVLDDRKAEILLQKSRLGYDLGTQVAVDKTVKRANALFQQLLTQGYFDAQLFQLVSSSLPSLQIGAPSAKNVIAWHAKATAARKQVDETFRTTVIPNVTKMLHGVPSHIFNDVQLPWRMSRFGDLFEHVRAHWSDIVKTARGEAVAAWQAEFPSTWTILLARHSGGRDVRAELQAFALDLLMRSLGVLLTQPLLDASSIDASLVVESPSAAQRRADLQRKVMRIDGVCAEISAA